MRKVRYLNRRKAHRDTKVLAASGEEPEELNMHLQECFLQENKKKIAMSNTSVPQVGRVEGRLGNMHRKNESE